MRLATKFGILADLLIITSGAHAACNLTSDMTAVSVQSNQGQGGFTCTSVNLSDGTQAVDLLSVGKISVTKTTGGGSKTLDWSMQGADPGKTYPLALVRVVNNGEGTSCNYTYDGISTEDSGLGNLAAGPVKIGSGSGTLFCGSLNQVKIPVEEEVTLPTTTAGVNCTGSISDLTLPDGSIVVAESLDGETVAACSSTADSGQAYCEDRCVNPMDRGELATCLATAGSGAFLGGEFGLNACKPCDTALDLIDRGETPPFHPEEDGTPMEFCWEKTASAYSGPGDLSHPVEAPEYTPGVPRTVGSMLKHTPIRQSETSITWYNYCYKTTVTVNGRDYVVTTCR